MAATSVTEAIERAESLLPGIPAPDGEQDARWEAIIEISEFIEEDPKAIWLFVERWGLHPDEDLRSAIATCLLEHLLEHHFDLIFPRVQHLARASSLFADSVQRCWCFGQTELPENAAKFDQLRKELLTRSWPPAHSS